MCVSCLGRCPRLTYWRPVGPGFIVQTLFFHIESVRVSIFPQNYGGFTIHQIQTAFAITNWDMACGTDPKCRIYVEELMDDEAEDEVPTLLAAGWSEVFETSGHLRLVESNSRESENSARQLADCDSIGVWQVKTREASRI